MKKILLIDDLREFRITRDDADYAIARTTVEGVQAVQADGEWDEIWLDHDLGKIDGIKTDVLPVLAVFEERAVWDNPVKVGTVFVHTSNGSGADTMYRSLLHYGYNARRVDADDYFFVPAENMVTDED